jgi:HlyD family secretion protein
MTWFSARRRLGLGAAALAAALSGAGLWWHAAGQSPAAPATVTGKPALTVEAISPQPAQWPRLLAANGNVAAWQEAIIGAEISNYRLTEVLVNVGDKVVKGQLLARIADDNVAADLAQSTAAVAEAEANLAEAKFNGDRARQLRAAGFYSPQQAQQSQTSEQTARARLDAARARKQADALRLAQTLVRAPDSGVISARTATVGSLTQSGQELFRLIRGGRLEWRAEVTAGELGQLRPGTAATVTTANGATVGGRVRVVAPTVDPTTRNALVYVDLPVEAGGKGAHAGTFARGQFELGSTPALTLPQSSVVLRDGFAYVFRLGSDDKVMQTKVDTGRRLGERIEILAGLDAEAKVVAAGAGFLSDGDSVRVVATSPAR